MRQRFVALDRYDPSAISGTILECEDENYAVGLDGEPDYTQRERALLLRGLGSSTRSLTSTNSAVRSRAVVPTFRRPRAVARARLALLGLWRSMAPRHVSPAAPYGELVQRTLRTADRKRLNADGSEPTTVMHGETIPRPVHVNPRTRIGKEITVDPTDTDEDFTAEMLSATDVLEYSAPRRRSMVSWGGYGRGN